MRSPAPSLLQTEPVTTLQIFSFEILQSFHLHGPLLNSLLYVCHFCTDELRSGHSIPDVALSVLSGGGRITYHDLLTIFYIVQPRIPLSFLVASWLVYT